MHLKTLYKTLRETLNESDARYILKKRYALSQTDLITNPDQEIDETAALNDLQHYKNGTPLSRIYNEREFWGMNFKLSAATLDPRPDTETLIEAVLKRYKNQPPPKTILDLGTGTGCILITLLTEFPHATGRGTDISPEALETATQNAKTNNVAPRATFTQSKWWNNINATFDLIVSNPPYIPDTVILELDKNVQNHDPILALSGGQDGLQAYKAIFSKLYDHLNQGGKAFFEIGYDQEKSTRRLATESRLSVESTTADLAGHIRVLELSRDKPNGDK